MDNKNKNVGLPPGTLVYKGPKREHNTEISLIRYNKDFHDFKIIKIEECFHDENTINWIDVNGIHDEKVVEEIGKVFNLHALLLEDVMDTTQRPSVDEHGEYTFIKLKMLNYNKKKHIVESEQVSLVLGDRFVISFQEKPGDVFEPLRNRIEGGKGRIRGKKSDYLLYAIIDVIVDNYFTIIEEIGLEISRLETEVFQNPDQKILEKVLKNKKQLLTLRKSIYPMREVIAKIQKEEFKLILKDTHKYFNDLYDNIIHLIDAIETYRDINSGLKDSYISSISLKMNQVMQMLTIMSTIFIPITFIAGVYGMNFKVIPELDWKYGYAMFWFLTFGIAGSLIFLFKKKKWL